jgi:membrane protease YdiL (CAAX protease family)
MADSLVINRSLAFSNAAFLIVLAVVGLQHLSLYARMDLIETIFYFALFLTVIGLRLWQAFHLVLFVLLLNVLRPVFPTFLTSISGVYYGIVFAISIPIVLRLRQTKGLLSWFRKGKIDRFSKVSIFVVSSVAGIALLLWAAWTDSFGVAEQMVKGVAGFPKVAVLIGLPIFAAINAFSEEVVYRGILQEAALRSGMSPAIAILLQAMGFASIHYASGFPNGFLGYAMTLTYGAALGYQRHRTRGILVPYLTHIGADLVIFIFLYFKFL